MECGVQILVEIKLPETLIAEAQAAAETTNRTLQEQVEHWIKIGMIVEENPDLPYEFIQQILIAKEEVESGGQ